MGSFSTSKKPSGGREKDTASPSISAPLWPDPEQYAENELIGCNTKVLLRVRGVSESTCT